MNDASACAAPSQAASVLSGIRVLDLARVLAGPWAAQLLADFGADVVKIERPGSGDDTRAWEPSFASPADPSSRQSAYFCSTNRGKRSVTIDFAREEGARLVRELAAGADVLIENYKTGTLARYGLGYEALAKVNPRLIYCSVTGFGQTGPYRHRAGYDTIIQAMGGLMSITGERDGCPGAGPQRAGLPVIDLMTGVYAALAIMGALRHRDATGRGQALDLALLDVQVSALSYFGMNYLASGVVPQRMGNANPVTYPSGNFATADGTVVLIVGNDAQFARFCEALGEPQWARDARFLTSADRVRNAGRLGALVGAVLAERSSAHWIDALERRGVPCAPINDLESVFADSHVRARGNVDVVHHPAFGDIPVLANPMRLSATSLRPGRPPPALGEHTDEVLRSDLGRSEAAVRALRESGVV